MREYKMTFIDACLSGKAKPEDIVDWVDAWTKKGPRTPLTDVLGMSSFEYDIWTQNGDYLYHILGRRAVARAQTKRGEQGPAECEAEITALRVANTRQVLRIGILEHVKCKHFDKIANTRPCELPTKKDAEIAWLNADNERLQLDNDFMFKRIKELGTEIRELGAENDRLRQEGEA